MRAMTKRAKTVVEKPRKKKPLKKYGTESNKDLFEFHGDSDGEFGGCSGKDMGPRKLVSSWGLATGQTMALEDADTFRVRPGAIYKPGMSFMPPPTSKSTSQTHASETSTVATMSNETHAKSSPAEPKATENTGSVELTSSDSRMPDPTMSSRGRGDGERAPDTDRVENLEISQGLDRDATAPELAGTSSSPSILSPSKTITVARRDLAAQPLIEDVGIGDDKRPVALPIYHTSETVAPVLLLPGPSHSHEGTDDLSLPSNGPETWNINQATVSKNRKRKNENVQADEPGSDDTAIGLPKDQYQPRPSRSRSGRGTEEVIVPADFSKRPEAVVKKKGRAKRSKTTAFHELRPKDENDEEEDPIDYKPAMEAIKKIPAREIEKRKELALTEQTIDPDLDEDPQPDPKPVVKAAKKKKQRGRPKKGVTEAPEGKVLGDIHTNALQVDLESERVQDLALAEKAKRGPEAKEAPSAICEELVHDSDDELGDVDEMIRKSSNILSETQDSGTTPKPVEKAVNLLSPIKTTASSSTKAMETPPETPPKAGTPAQQGLDKHSPISSGKVAYRVGLSKRARIAPLLKIVRKA